MEYQCEWVYVVSDIGQFSPRICTLLTDEPESRYDLLTAAAIVRMIDYKRLEQPLYIGITTSISRLAKKAHIHRTTVKRALLRLMEQYRIDLPRAPQRGVNKLVVHVGVQQRKGGVILFTPTLTPSLLFKETLKAGDKNPDTRAAKIVHLKRHAARCTNPIWQANMEEQIEQCIAAE